MRPRHSPIFAFCERWELADSLALNYGVTASVIRFNHTHPEQTVEHAIQHLLALGRLQPGNTVVVITSLSAGEQIVDAVQMRVVN